jgi:predicted nucleic acid-binding protein
VKTYFLDSSALVKRYITETGSNWIRTITQIESQNIIVIARITWVEVISAFSRLNREERITLDELQEIIEILKNDWQTSYQVVEIDKTVIEKA